MRSYCQSLKAQNASRVLRVFLSSTFRDFQEERDYLRDKVFPLIRQKARTRGVELMVVDLRWGLTDDESRLGSAVSVCLEEVDRSKPHFLALMGERYGWVPQSGNHGPANPAHLNLDHNSDQVQKWFAQEESVTAMEIRRGVLENPEERKYAFFYFRDKKLTEALMVKSGEPSAFQESGKSAEKLVELKREILEGSEFGNWHIRDYKSIEELACQVEADLCKALDGRFPEDSTLDAKRLADIHHEAYARDRVRVYFPNKDFALDVLSHLNAKESVFLIGPSGQGKSSAIAYFSKEFCKQNSNAFVFVHFIGVSGENSIEWILGRLLSSLEWEDSIQDHGGSSNAHGQPKNENELWVEVVLALSREARKRPCLLAIDAIDQLRCEDSKLRNLLKFCVPGVSVLLSGREQPIVLSEIPGIRLPLLDSRQIGEIITNFLEPYRKHLTNSQRQLIQESPQCKNPLYLRIFLDELRHFGGLRETGSSQNEYMDRVIKSYLSCADAPELYERVFKRLEARFSFKKLQEFLFPLILTRLGMAPSDLSEIFEIPEIDIAIIRSNLADHLLEDNGLLRPFHLELEKAIQSRYGKDPESILTNEKFEKCFRKKIIEYYEKKECGSRIILELTWQYFKIKDIKKLYEIITDFTSIEIINNYYGIYELKKYFDFVLENDLRSSDKILKRFKKQKLSNFSKNNIGVLVSLSYLIGDDRLESSLLKLWKNKILNDDDEFNYNMAMAKYKNRIGKINNAIKHIKSATQNSDKIKSFSAKIHLLTYLSFGGNYKNIKIILPVIKKEYSRIKSKLDIHTVAAYWRNSSFIWHDLDDNYKFELYNAKASELYKKLGMNYEDLICRINLGDGQWGRGKLKNANMTLRLALEEARQKKLPHVIDIATICLGNLLSAQGNYLEALELYGEGISLARKLEHKWDEYYGLIYESLCKAEFQNQNGGTCDSLFIEDLLMLSEKARKSNYRYLSDIAIAYALIISLLSGKRSMRLKQSAISLLKSKINSASMYSAVFLIVFYKKDKNLYDKAFYEMCFRLKQVCGCKGRPLIFFKINEVLMNDERKHMKFTQIFNPWAKRYLGEYLERVKI